MSLKSSINKPDNSLSSAFGRLANTPQEAWSRNYKKPSLTTKEKEKELEELFKETKSEKQKREREERKAKEKEAKSEKDRKFTKWFNSLSEEEREIYRQQEREDKAKIRNELFSDDKPIKSFSLAQEILKFKESKNKR